MKIEARVLSSVISLLGPIAPNLVFRPQIPGEIFILIF